MGLIHVYTGEGKGKTTACVGLAIRAAGSGLHVIFGQFLKDNSSGELNILQKVENITCILCDRSFGFIKMMDEATLCEARAYYRAYFQKLIKAAEEQDADLLVMDEFMASYVYGMIDQEEALHFLRNRGNRLEIALSGRDVPQEISELADYVSEIKKCKHPYDRGILARKGIEW